MKTLLLCSILSISLTVLPAWSQQHKGGFVGLNAQLNKLQHNYRLYLCPEAGWQYHRHQVAAGPIIILKEISGALEELPRLTGINLNYRYLLTRSEDKHLRLFVEITSKAQLLKESWTSNHWNEALQEYKNVQQGSRELLWQNFAGIGALYALHPRLHLHLSAGAGYSISNLQKTGSSPDVNDSTFDYRPYKNKIMAYSLNLGTYLLLGH